MPKTAPGWTIAIYTIIGALIRGLPGTVVSLSSALPSSSFLAPTAVSLLYQPR